jgi:hypothetical protein
MKESVNFWNAKIAHFLFIFVYVGGYTEPDFLFSF